MKKKTIIVILLVALMSLTVISGCNKEKSITAEELVSNAFAKEKMTSIDADIAMSLDVDADMSDYLSTDDMSGTTTMNIVLNVNANVKANNNTAYVDGNLDTTFFGMNMNYPIKSYVTIEGNEIQTLTWDAEESSWHKESNTYEDIDPSMFNSQAITLTCDMFESYELQKSEKSDTLYTVIGVLSYDSVMKALDNASINEMLADVEFDTKNIKFDVILKFDKETKDCTSVELNAASDELTYEDTKLSVNKLGFTVKYNQIGGIEVVIPQEVLDSTY